MKRRPWTKWKKGDFVIGKFLGFREDAYSRDVVILKIKKSSFKKRKWRGKKFEIPYSRQTSSALGHIKKGEFVAVIYHGVVKIQSGLFKGKEAHDVTFDSVEEWSKIL